MFFKLTNWQMAQKRYSRSNCSGTLCSLMWAKISWHLWNIWIKVIFEMRNHMPVKKQNESKRTKSKIISDNNLHLESHQIAHDCTTMYCNFQVTLSAIKGISTSRIFRRSVNFLGSFFRWFVNNDFSNWSNFWFGTRYVSKGFVVISVSWHIWGSIGWNLN